MKNKITKHKISFTVPGDPVAKARPRVTRYGTYTPEKSKVYEQVIQYHAPRLEQLLTGPLEVSIWIFRRVPKNFSKKKRLEAEIGDLRPITRPDVDNYEKAVYDALNGIVWNDDGQVVTAHLYKFYDEEPRIEVDIKIL